MHLPSLMTESLPFSADGVWQEGKASGAVYNGEEKLTELLVQVNAGPEGSVRALSPCARLRFFLVSSQQLT